MVLYSQFNDCWRSQYSINGVMKAFITQTLKEFKKPFLEFFKNLSHFLNNSMIADAISK